MGHQFYSFTPCSHSHFAHMWHALVANAFFGEREPILHRHLHTDKIREFRGNILDGWLGSPTVVVTEIKLACSFLVSNKLLLLLLLFLVRKKISVPKTGSLLKSKTLILRLFFTAYLRNCILISYRVSLSYAKAILTSIFIRDDLVNLVIRTTWTLGWNWLLPSWTASLLESYCRGLYQWWCVAVAEDEDDDDDDDDNEEKLLTSMTLLPTFNKQHRHRLYQCLVTSWTHDQPMRRRYAGETETTCNDVNGEYHTL